jgi:hypothetical protein
MGTLVPQFAGLEAANTATEQLLTLEGAMPQNMTLETPRSLSALRRPMRRRETIEAPTSTVHQPRPSRSRRLEPLTSGSFGLHLLPPLLCGQHRGDTARGRGCQSMRSRRDHRSGHRRSNRSLQGRRGWRPLGEQSITEGMHENLHYKGLFRETGGGLSSRHRSSLERPRERKGGARGGQGGGRT